MKDATPFNLLEHYAYFYGHYYFMPSEAKRDKVIPICMLSMVLTELQNDIFVFKSRSDFSLERTALRLEKPEIATYHINNILPIIQRFGFMYNKPQP